MAYSDVFMCHSDKGWNVLMGFLFLFVFLWNFFSFIFISSLRDSYVF